MLLCPFPSPLQHCIPHPPQIASSIRFGIQAITNKERHISHIQMNSLGNNGNYAQGMYDAPLEYFNFRIFVSCNKCISLVMHPWSTLSLEFFMSHIWLCCRHAVVSGANKGIGLETVRQLATFGVTVVLAARDEERGTAAAAELHKSGLSNVIFHQLDVLDPDSIISLANFIESQFGKLDILVNNAATSGVIVDEDRLRAMNIDPVNWLSGRATNLVQDVIKTTYEKAEECLNTNYYGCKRMAEALLPLLQRSTCGGRIVNISSLRSELRRIPNEEIRKELADIDTLTEEKIDRILERFLHDLKQDAIEENGWSKMLPAYSISKATLNAYTRLFAKKCPNMLINCVHPGYINTDLNWHTGTMTTAEGAKGPVKLALLPECGPSGCYFDLTEVAEF